MDPGRGVVASLHSIQNVKFKMQAQRGCINGVNRAASFTHAQRNTNCLHFAFCITGDVVAPLSSLPPVAVPLRAPRARAAARDDERRQSIAGDTSATSGWLHLALSEPRKSESKGRRTVSHRCESHAARSRGAAVRSSHPRSGRRTDGDPHRAPAARTSSPAVHRGASRRTPRGMGAAQIEMESSRRRVGLPPSPEAPADYRSRGEGGQPDSD
jgi:hypothetical protein